MAAIQKLGFRSASKKPLQLLDNLLYGRNPRFKNDNGRFSPMGTATREAGTKPATPGCQALQETQGLSGGTGEAGRVDESPVGQDQEGRRQEVEGGLSCRWRVLHEPED